MHFLQYNENKKHGSDEFPVEYYYVNEEHTSYNMPFHWHKEWEIIRVLRGSLVINADSTEYFAKQGDILLLRGGTLHGGTPQQCIYECFNFDLDRLFTNVHIVRDYLRPFFRNKLMPTIYFAKYDLDVYPIVDELFSSFTSHKTDAFLRLETLGNISRLFGIILEKGYYTENIEKITDVTEKITQLKPVLEYIETHFSEPLSLTILSEIIGMNPKYFCKFFHSITQQTPMNYVNYYRIEQAANLLLNTEKTITEIGFECGFNETSHFLKTFKKYKYITPKQYQKKKR